MITPPVADALRRFHPLRIQHEWISDKNPWLASLSGWAELVRQQRRPAQAENPYSAVEKRVSDGIVDMFDSFRDTRDTLSESLFGLMYGPGGWGALFPPEAVTRRGATEFPARGATPEPAELFETGGMLEAVMRIVAGAVIDQGVFDRRSARIFRAILERSQFKDVSPQQVRETFKQQARLVRQDPERAIVGLAVMLPTHDERVKAIDVVRQILMLAPEDVRMERPAARRLAEVLEIEPREITEVPEAAQA
jgi:hypothetical protein